MAKKELQLHSIVSPTNTVIVSAYDETGKACACTVAFYMLSSHVPPCITVGINLMHKRQTLGAMLHSNAFTVGFPGANQVKEADYIGIESGYNTDKLANIGYTTSEAQTVHAPVIDAMKLSLECEIIHTVTIGSHLQVVGEVKRIIADEEILTDADQIDIDKLRPILYDKEQRRYVTTGEKIGAPFNSGKELKEKFQTQ